ncbi:hypothetical protein [Lacisediminihabitans sp.]|uniref:hypothetical protein n=1 Tax=Lacisediminihabitans sp. TaxID=2787631 RepID=UPI00374D0683
MSEWPKADADCLTAHGSPAVASRDGGVSQHVLPGQEERAAIAGYECEALYPVDPQFNEPLNKSQLAFLYAYFVDRLSPCVKSAGYSVARPPSLHSFEESYGSSESWSPYLSVSEPTSEKWTALNRRCPQFPSGLYG